MPKQEYKILEFHGGTNFNFDAKDIADNQNVQSQLSVKNPGRLTAEGAALSLYGGASATINGKSINDITTTSGFKAGYGLFTFPHDYDMEGDEIDTNYIVINDAADIDIYDPNQSTQWQEAKFTLGSRTSTVKPEYYNVDGALRVCDSNFGVTDVGIDTNAVINKHDVKITTESGTIAVGSIIQIEQEIMYVTSGSSSGTSITVIRGFANTKIKYHATNQDIYYINAPKYFGHIKQDRLFEAETSNSINVWTEDIQTPQPPNNTRTGAFTAPYLASSEGVQSLRIYNNLEGGTSNYPTEAEKVVLEFEEEPGNTGIKNIEYHVSSYLPGNYKITTSGYGNSASASNKLSKDNMVVFSDMQGVASSLEGTHEVKSVATDGSWFTILVENTDGGAALDYTVSTRTTAISDWEDYSGDGEGSEGLKIVGGSEGDLTNAIFANGVPIHITGETGVNAFNGIYTAYNITDDDNRIWISNAHHADFATGGSAGSIQQLIGIVRREEAEGVISEDLKRKWNFAMSFTYDGPAQEVQESLLTQGYTVYESLDGNGLLNTLRVAITDTDETIQVDSTANISAGDIIMIGTEQMKVLSITDSQNLEATRGVNGTAVNSTIAVDTQIYIISELSPTKTVDWTNFIGTPKSVIKFLYNHGDSGFLGNELIADQKNREFNATPDWTEYSPDGSAPTFARDASNNHLEITGTASSNKEGGQLALTKMIAPTPLKTYRISSKIWWDDGSDPGTGSIFKYSFGETVSTAFDVAATSTGTTYTQDVVASNSTGPLIIYKEGSTNEKFSIDDVSVKEVINSTWNPRINGFKIYMRDVTDEDSSKEWRLFSNVNFNKGTYTIFAADDSELVLEQPGTWADDCQVATITGGTDIKIRPIDTYLSENMITEQTIIDAQYKCSAVVGRRLYIGNIKQGGRTYPDRMLRSPVNKFDTFPETNYIDVAVGDGDSITALKSFGDRLLQFKKNKVYVINVGGQSEYLESEYNNAGITFPSQITKTNNGIAWINSSGLWFFDGREITNLTRYLRESGFTVGLTDLNAPKIGYDAINDRLIFAPKIVAGMITSYFIYSLPLQALQGGYLSQILPFGSNANYFTNFMNDSDGDLIIGYVDGGSSTKQELNFYQWSDSNTGNQVSPNTTSLWKSKDIDFGSPAVDKKIYKVYVTYKTNGISGVKLYYGVNGSSSLTGEFKETISPKGIYYTGTIKDGGFAPISSNEWYTVELKPTSSINNVKSIQLSFVLAPLITGTAQSGSSSVIRLAASGPSDTDNAYNGYNIYIYDGAGRYNSREILDYDGDGGETGAAHTVTFSTGSDDLTDNGYGNAASSTSKYIVGSLDPSFEINDITIVYRQKKVK